VSYYIPDRIDEGYGLNRSAIDRLKAEGAQLIITVDCGVSDHDEGLTPNPQVSIPSSWTITRYRPNCRLPKR
jgi:hypothetical protein